MAEGRDEKCSTMNSQSYLCVLLLTIYRTLVWLLPCANRKISPSPHSRLPLFPPTGLSLVKRPPKGSSDFLSVGPTSCWGTKKPVDRRLRRVKPFRPGRTVGPTYGPVKPRKEALAVWREGASSSWFSIAIGRATCCHFCRHWEKRLFSPSSWREN